jgi:hypothetical protein
MLPQPMHEEVFPELVEAYCGSLYRFALSLARSAVSSEVTSACVVERSPAAGV